MKHSDETISLPAAGHVTRNQGQNLDIVRLRNGFQKLVLILRSFTGISVPLYDWLESYALCYCIRVLFKLLVILEPSFSLLMLK